MEWDAATREALSLPQDEIIQVFDEAVRKSKASQDAVISLLCDLTEVPGGVERLVVELNNPDPEVRRPVLSVIGEKRLRNLAPLLTRIIMYDESRECRARAIGTAGKLGDLVNLPAVLQVAGQKEFDDVVVRALANFGQEECRTYLRQVFERPLGPAPPPDAALSVDPAVHKWRFAYSDKRHQKLDAAMGLAKLGDKEALTYIGEVLYEPEINFKDFRGRVFDPGQSRNAAQALIEVFDLSFRWDTTNLDRGYRKDLVEPVQQWWEANKSRLQT